MGLNSVDKLAKTLGNTNLAVSDLQQNISPDEEDAQMQLRFTDALELIGKLKITKKVPDEGALVFDSPVLGQMFDNDEKEFDKGYDESQDEILIEQEF
jgi:hypothetical protein